MLGNVHWVESTAAQYRALRSRLTLSPDAGEKSGKADKHSKQPRVSEPDMKAFVLALMQNTNGAVPIFGAANGPIGLAVRRLLDSDARLSVVPETGEGSTVGGKKPQATKPRVPPPARKQYVLRWVVPRPSNYSRPTPQRMYVNIDERNEFRLCGAFSEDVTLSWSHAIDLRDEYVFSLKIESFKIKMIRYDQIDPEMYSNVKLSYW